MPDLRPGRPRRQAAIAAVCLLGFAGCIAPTEYITEVYADVWDGRLVLALNLFSFSEWEHRLAVYQSERGDPCRWRLRGTYSGRSRAIAVRGGELWVLFGDGPARTYPLGGSALAGTSAPPGMGPSTGGTDAPGVRPPDSEGGSVSGTQLSENAAGPSSRDASRPSTSSARRTGLVEMRRIQGEIAKFPFDWEPLALCGDGEGGLWAVGIKEARITAARLEAGEEATWQLSFPPGPVLKELQPEREGGSPRSRRRDRRASRRAAQSGSSAAGNEGGAPTARVRACVSGGLYVFWSITYPGADSADRILAARLGPGSRGALAAPAASGSGREAEWTEFPALAFPHDDFCAAPTADGAPGVVLHRPASRPDEEDDEGPRRAELDPARGRWHPPEAFSAPSGRFLFGYVPCVAWVRWDGGELLLRSNTQRVEMLHRKEGRWELLRPASRLALDLPEIWVLALLGGGFLLAMVGSAALAVRMVRLGRTRRALASPFASSEPRRLPPAERRHHGESGARAASAREDARKDGAPVAPIAHRTVAALLDIIIVDGVATWLVGFPGPLANPLVPETWQFVALGVALAMLAVYGAVLEAALGATLGKLAVGLRVESADGGRPSVRQAILRNLLRPVDLLPPYLGAIGLSAMTVTAGRRLGDLAAGTLVVKAVPGGEKP